MAAPVPPSMRTEDYEELRIGLVLNGGVSLAIWMGGVTTEVDCLRRRIGAYGEVLDLLRTDARVDVISGASAGGLNGGFLATAIAYGRPLEGLRDLWLERGSLDKLLRSPFEKDPPSIMDGDGYFLPALEEAFRTVAGGGGRSDDPVHLTMMTAVLTGISRGLADDFGAVFPDVSHLGCFTFEKSAPGADES